MTVVFLNFSGGAKTRSWQHLPRFVRPSLAGPYAFFCLYHLMRKALVRDFFFCHMVFHGNCTCGRMALVVILQI